jgi:hypothetical protein
LTATTLPVLHVPDEPTVLAERWLAAVLDGQDLGSVLSEEKDGVIAWLWSRWRTLASAGLSEDGLGEIVSGYRREIWLWLAGERTWAQCCSGLIGRVNRRLAGGGDGPQG